jgi:hypothetical protein
MRAVDVQVLLNGDALAAQSWLERSMGSAADLPSDFNWHGFAQGAALRARSVVLDEAEADSWAGVAVAVYAKLAAHPDGFTFELSAMSLRAWMVSRFGSVDGHPVRDWSRIMTWFLQGTVMSFEDAELAAKKLRQLSVDRWSEEIDLVRSLRRIKNQMGVFRWMVHPKAPTEIQRWLTLWELLP